MSQLDSGQGAKREIFAAVMMDPRHPLISYAELFYGSIAGSDVHPREVVKQVLRLNAGAIILRHYVKSLRRLRVSP